MHRLAAGVTRRIEKLIIYQRANISYLAKENEDHNKAHLEKEFADNSIAEMDKEVSDKSSVEMEKEDFSSKRDFSSTMMGSKDMLSFAEISFTVPTKKSRNQADRSTNDKGTREGHTNLDIIQEEGKEQDERALRKQRREARRRKRLLDQLVAVFSDMDESADENENEKEKGLEATLQLK